MANSGRPGSSPRKFLNAKYFISSLEELAKDIDGRRVFTKRCMVASMFGVGLCILALILGIVYQPSAITLGALGLGALCTWCVWGFFIKLHRGESDSQNVKFAINSCRIVENRFEGKEATPEDQEEFGKELQNVLLWLTDRVDAPLGESVQISPPAGLLKSAVKKLIDSGTTSD